jgi:hypothetical protein
MLTENEIPARMLHRVVDQHQVRIALRLWRQRGEVHVRPHIAIDDQERRIAQYRQRIEDAAAGFQRHCAFVDEVQTQAPAITIAQCRFELIAQPRRVDHHVAEACRRQPLKMPHDERFATGDQQRLGRGERERTHAFALAGTEDDRLHARLDTGNASAAIAGLIRSCSSVFKPASSGWRGSTSSR